MASVPRKPKLEIPNCTAEEKRSALDHVLQSNTFERADLLRRFLRYICEMEIAGRADEINEYTIATDALGRPATYSPGEDSSVRSRAHAVREKLAAFYESEGAEAPLRIELHKGSYIPHFISRAESERRAELSPPELPPPRIVPAAARGFAAGAILSAVLAVLAFMLLAPMKVRNSVPAVLREFWGPLLQPGNDVILCIATAPSMLLHSYQDGTLPPEPRIFPTPPEVGKWYDDLHMLDGGGRLYAQTSQNTILFGDNLAAVAAAKTLAAAGKATQILPEYSIGQLALRGRDVVLIGSPNYSPLAARILQKTPFSVRYDPATKLEMISTESSTGEPAVVYSSQRNAQSGGGGLKVAYGLITVAPSPPGGDESGHRIVLISGISSAGTQAAMEFFCSTASLSNLKARMGASSAALPASYQVVVRCGVVKGLALGWAYETHRIIDKPAPIE
jgi:hypothetical protein